MLRTAATILFFTLVPLACSPQAALPPPVTASGSVDSARVLADLYFLSHPALEGRAAGSPGNEAAAAYIEAELLRAGVRPLGGGFRHPVPLPAGATGEREGANVVGWVAGTERPDRYIVVTAHFDHLGVIEGEIYHGADDNASGASALLEIARHVAASPLRNSVVFAALDAEEMGLLGARAFVRDPPVSLAAIALNVNMDMVSRSAADELYAAGTYHYPVLAGIVERAAARAPLTLLTGHDRPDLPPGDDWTMLSDHGAFHEVGIPFIYFGVEDHPDYHRPTDTFENTDPGFFVRAIATVLDLLHLADGQVDAIEAATAPAAALPAP
jgi:Zn-dependent M28 family amino/carboxypeptidase